jgi:hypothetical protein
MSPVKNRRHTMTKAQIAYNKRIVKKIAAVEADLALPEMMIAEWTTWLVDNATVELDHTRPIQMPTWFSDTYKRRAEKGEDIKVVARKMVGDYKKKVAAARLWVDQANAYLAEQGFVAGVTK